MDTPSYSLLELIHETFNEDEVRTLCFALHIDFEDLPASLGKQGKVRELILLCARAHRLDELVAYGRQQRPHLNWPDPHLLANEQLLGQAVTPPQPYEPETILIPAGPFLMGSLPAEGGADVERPQHEVTLPAYAIGRYPVTNAQYAVFLKQAKYSPPRGWLGPKAPPGKEQHPVVNVSWYDAVAYCDWLRVQSTRPYRLPTEAEWEKAARGTDGRVYPWGNVWADGRCHHHSDTTAPVNAHPEGASPFGCLDMAGNVREWTSTLWGSDYQTPEYPYPYQAEDGREDTAAGTAVYRIVRGSAYVDDQARHRCAARAWYAPDNKNKHRGFRITIARLHTPNRPDHNHDKQ